jgi:hypothetical protein
MRATSLFWGIVIVILGALLLLNSTGVLPFTANIWGIIGAAFLIILGAWFLLAPTLFRQDFTDETVSIPLADINQANITLKYGAGDLRLTALDKPGVLLEGVFAGGINQDLRRDGTTANLTVSSKVRVFTFPFTPGLRGLRWQLGLSRDIPLTIRMESGACDAHLDLSALKVTEMRLETGASSTEIVLPEQAGFTRVTVKSGAASVVVRVPQGVAARVKSQSGLASVSVDKNRFPHNESPDFATAANKADISIETGVGSVEVK